MRVWICASFLLFACGARQSAAPEPSDGYPSYEVSGVVVDEHGSPLAGAEVPLCACNSVGCGALRRAMYLSPVAPSQLWKSLQEAHGEPGYGSVHVTRTDAEGKWHARVPLCGDHTKAYVWKARYVSEVIGFRQLVASPQSSKLMPAATLSVAISCTDPPCPIAALVTNDHHLPDFQLPATESNEQRLVFHGLPAGRYEVKVYRGLYAPGEDRGRAAMDVLPGEVAELSVPMVPSGTGKPMVGTLSVVDKEGVPMEVPTGLDILVETQCGDDYITIARKARVSSTDGTFRIEDIGPPPCRVSFSHRIGKSSYPYCKKPDTEEAYDAPIRVRSRAWCPENPADTDLEDRLVGRRE